MTTSKISSGAEPDEVYERDGMAVAMFGQAPAQPYGAPVDPIPTVYASDRGDTIEVSEMPFTLDEAEALIARLQSAVRYQQRRIDERIAAELNAMARGNAASHDWHRTPPGVVECRRCRSVAYSFELLLPTGAVPVCGDRCRQPWHEVCSSLPGEAGAAKCIFCGKTYEVTVEPGASDSSVVTP